MKRHLVLGISLPPLIPLLCVWDGRKSGQVVNQIILNLDTAVKTNSHRASEESIRQWQYLYPKACKSFDRSQLELIRLDFYLLSLPENQTGEHQILCHKLIDRLKSLIQDEKPTLFKIFSI